MANLIIINPRININTVTFTIFSLLNQHLLGQSSLRKQKLYNCIPDWLLEIALFLSSQRWLLCENPDKPLLSSANAHERYVRTSSLCDFLVLDWTHRRGGKKRRIFRLCFSLFLPLFTSRLDKPAKLKFEWGRSSIYRVSPGFPPPQVVYRAIQPSWPSKRLYGSSIPRIRSIVSAANFRVH